MVKIDTKPIQTELQELSGQDKVKVKLSKHLDIGCSIRQDDKGFLVSLNPSKIRSPEKLEQHLNMCRETIGGE